MKIALFLGAGASVPYGMPTTRELRDKIQDDDVDFPRKDLMDSAQFPDIEHILSALDELISFASTRAGILYMKFSPTESGSGNYAQPINGLDNHEFMSYVRQSYTSKDSIEKLITENYNWDPSHNENAEKILRPLFDLVKSRDDHITVFTTNYDIVIESYCRTFGRNIECVDGFKFHGVKNAIVWDGKFVPQNDICSTKVFLYKLHGSMNWLADRTDNHKSILQKPDTGASDDRTRDMYIRPSLDAKDEATQKEPYATILRLFTQKLRSFDACVVIGYSFRDPHITEELVKFAGNGKILALLSPTASSDFENNAVKKFANDKKNEWRGSGSVKGMILGYKGTSGLVYALNDKLDNENVNILADAIKSLIADSIQGREVPPRT